MPETPPTVTPEVHRALAVEANSAAWELLSRPEAAAMALSPADGNELRERAYAAAYHWRRAAGRTPANDARAAWLLSRAHIVTGRRDLALHYAEVSFEIVADAGLDDFDLAYALEAQARSLARVEALDDARRLRRMAAATPIADDEDREIFMSDLASEPWFGLEADPPAPPA